MGHNSVVLGHPKSTGIPRVDKLSTGPWDLGCHTMTAPGPFMSKNLPHRVHLSTFI